MTTTHSSQQDPSTETFSWGSIKWGVTADRFPGAPITVGEVVINPTKGHDIHTHPGSDEVLHVIEGEGVQTVGDTGEFAVKVGDCVYIPRGTEHSTFNTGWRQLRLIAIYSLGASDRGAPPVEHLTVHLARTGTPAPPRPARPVLRVARGLLGSHPCNAGARGDNLGVSSNQSPHAAQRISTGVGVWIVLS